MVTTHKRTSTQGTAFAKIQGLSNGEKLVESFTFQASDGFVTGSSKLSITIFGTNDGVTITGLGGNVEQTVREDGLGTRGTEPAGSSPNTPALKQSGSFQVSAVDGLKTVVIDGVTVISNGALTGTLIVDTALGKLTITGFTPVIAGGEVIGGTINYEYPFEEQQYRS